MCFRRSSILIMCLCLSISAHALRPGGTRVKRVDALTKKSTAVDVLTNLNNTNRLASYAKSGGVAVVTGGNSGIGSVSVETLALAGMRVVLCARDVKAAEKEVSQMSSKDNIRIQRIDLTDLDSIEDAANEIIEKEGAIDVMLLNAGVMATPYTKTKDGFELQIGTNHIAHHYLTRLILPKMNQGGRVVTVASTAHTFGDIDFDDLNYTSTERKYTPWGAYGQSKLANILFAKGLDDRLKAAGSDVLSVSLHPGVIKTNLWRYSNPLFQVFTNVIADKTVEQGAATNTYCSIVEPSAFDGGEYCMDCDVTMPNTSGQDMSGEKRHDLWVKTEELLDAAGKKLPENLF